MVCSRFVTLLNRYSNRTLNTTQTAVSASARRPKNQIAAISDGIRATETVSMILRVEMPSFTCGDGVIISFACSCVCSWFSITFVAKTIPSYPYFFAVAARSICLAILLVKVRLRFAGQTNEQQPHSMHSITLSF